MQRISLFSHLIFILSVIGFWLINAGFNGTMQFKWLALIALTMVMFSSYYTKLIPKKYFGFNFILYLFWLIKEIVLSAINVSKIIWSPNLPLTAKFGTIPLNLKEPAAQILYANSITLTPGTYTIELEQDSIFVHSIDAMVYSDLAAGIMEDKIAAATNDYGKNISNG